MPEDKIIAINKEFDCLAKNDIIADDQAIKIHLFSNILDMEGFNMEKLFDRLFKIVGENFLVVVSNNSREPAKRRIDQFLEIVNGFKSKSGLDKNFYDDRFEFTIPKSWDVGCFSCYGLIFKYNVGN